MILSIGQGMTWTAMWVSAASGVDPAEQGVASGMASMTQQIGGALGLALLVALANAQVRGADAASLLASQARAHRMGDRAQRPARPVRRRPGLAAAP
ncbi:hypothetical protein CSC34_6995 [Pseudomonas aeruginosa]|nr:hypothetical protein CSC34_6995 [Pseudomonas aeruginosa]